MRFDGAALFFAPWEFPPKTERLLELVGSFRRFGYQTAIIDWGGLFPWSDACFQSRFAYPEHAVVEAHKRARDTGLILIPRFPFGGGMSNFLSNPAYRNLRLGGCDPSYIDPTAAGATKFLRDLLEDMRALLPDLPGIYLDPGLGRPSDGGYIERLLKSLFRGLAEGCGGLALIGAASLAETEAAAGICAALAPEPDDLLRDRQCGLPPTVEIYLDLMPGGLLSTEALRAELSRAKRLREGFARFAEAIERCWKIVRDAAESSSLPPSLGYSPERSAAELSYAVDQLEKILDGVLKSPDVFSGLLEPLVAPGIVTRWLGSRIAAVEEQITRIREKSRLVEVWIETE